MDENENYKKWAMIECPVCKAKFEIWLAVSNWFSPETVDYLKENFYRFCPVCKILKELEEKQKKSE